MFVNIFVKKYRGQTLVFKLFLYFATATNTLVWGLLHQSPIFNLKIF